MYFYIAKMLITIKLQYVTSAKISYKYLKCFLRENSSLHLCKFRQIQIIAMYQIHCCQE